MVKPPIQVEILYGRVKRPVIPKGLGWFFESAEKEVVKGDTKGASHKSQSCKGCYMLLYLKDLI